MRRLIALGLMLLAMTALPGRVETMQWNQNTPIDEVVSYPGFGDWGRLIFPADEGYYSGSTLGDLRLTWYSNIQPAKTVEIVNTLRERADAGEQLFYPIYSEAEVAADPWKADTGLFFFRGKPGARFAICKVTNPCLSIWQGPFTRRYTMEYFTLNNGIKMPMAGIGVFMMSPAEAEAAVESALRSGVRLIDTANGYMNESGTGRGIRNSGVAREDIFLVTKLWPTVYGKATAIDETLQRLGTDYIDLLFLHQPTDNWREGYRAIEKAYKEGKVKAIGLSNFPDELLLEAIDTMEIMPQVVQVEAHPYFPQTELKQILTRTGMALMAWYPLGHGDKTLIQQPVFTELAEKYGKTNAQIILRWHVQSGNIVIPGSKNPAHIRDNFDIFDFALTDADMAAIAKLNSGVRYYTATPELIAAYATMELRPDL